MNVMTKVPRRSGMRLTEKTMFTNSKQRDGVWSHLPEDGGHGMHVMIGTESFGPVDISLFRKEDIARLPSATLWMKRAVDIVLSAVSLLLLSPFFLLIALAIRLCDGGPALFSQRRVGHKGVEFTLYKFRSMHLSSEADGIPQLCRSDDDRLTVVGLFIRNHHLDELPQLWNVLRGDMSFVGPRPERRYFVEQIRAINPDYDRLYQLRPGLFSHATLYNGYTDTMEKMLERLRMDLDYLDNRSIWLDAKIFFLTVFAILTGKKF